METTILKNQQTPEKQDKTQNYNDNNKTAWKNVTLGGVSGILIGAGAIYAANAYGQEPAQDNPSDSNNDSLQVAKTNDDMSFGDAFAAARAEVGPGGVFYWHGGIYNTYTAEEWNAMTEAERNEFANSVKPEIPASRISTSTETKHNAVTQNDHINNSNNQDEEENHNNRQANNNSHQDEEQNQNNNQTNNNVRQISQSDVEEGFGVDGAHIVSTERTGEGHIAVAYDMDGDGQPDIAVVDVDDSEDLSAMDIVMDREGNIFSVGDLSSTDINNVKEDGMQEAQAYNTVCENPDVAPDMPDYMSDGQVDGMVNA